VTALSRWEANFPSTYFVEFHNLGKHRSRRLGIEG
jgi:hypothetical protein